MWVLLRCTETLKVHDLGCSVFLFCRDELTTAKYVTKLPKGMHSVKGCGRTCPDPGTVHVTSDGVEIPFGAGVDSGTQNTSLLYNEYPFKQNAIKVFSPSLLIYSMQSLYWVLALSEQTSWVFSSHRFFANWGFDWKLSVFIHKLCFLLYPQRWGYKRLIGFLSLGKLALYHSNTRRCTLIPYQACDINIPFLFFTTFSPSRSSLYLFVTSFSVFLDRRLSDTLCMTWHSWTSNTYSSVSSIINTEKGPVQADRLLQTFHCNTPMYAQKNFCFLVVKYLYIITHFLQ